MKCYEEHGQVWWEGPSQVGWEGHREEQSGWMRGARSCGGGVEEKGVAPPS